MQDDGQFLKPGIAASDVSWPTLSGHEIANKEFKPPFEAVVFFGKVALDAGQVTWPEIKSENSK